MISSHLLHAVAIAAARVLPPERAFRLVERAATVLPPLDARDARSTARRLRLGTCLTRAMTVSARLRGSEVVIGVSPKRAPLGHAWVEHRGEVIGARADFEEIARLARESGLDPWAKRGTLDEPGRSLV